MLDNVLCKEAKKISKLYKISVDDALDKLNENLQENPELSEAITKAGSAKDFVRKRIFKDFIKKTRKEIYYQLRTYHKQEKDPIKSHLSTSERDQYIEDFYKQIDKYLKNSQYIFDVGGGLFPLTFDFDKYNQLKNYSWLDKDKKSYQTLLNYKNKNNLNNLFLYPHLIGDSPWKNYLPKTANEFDFVFLLKLVPVIYRQERVLIDKLAEIPGKRFLITGSKESMVKRLDIENRERRVLEKFISKTKLNVVGKVEIPNEFGYILE